ncbi:unnamed protein product [Schistosoma turkestanicum]|nr:unnamed protein product [Schistosoma turkestanicum]
MSSVESLTCSLPNICSSRRIFDAKCEGKGSAAGGILLKHRNEDKPLAPSLFIYKMSLSSEELYHQLFYSHIPETLALHDMSLISDQKTTSFPVTRPLFQPFPSELVFQRYEPGKSYELPLILRNLDKVSRTAHLIQNDTPYFKIKRINNQGSKVAAGLSLSFTIVFTPDANHDYRHDLMCVTDRELFSVPVFCIGPRAILELPDDISFGEVPVKVTSSKPFFVEPLSLNIQSGALKEIKVSFIPENTTEVSQKMFVIYDTGERLQINLHGQGRESLVYLKNDKVTVDGTFIGMHSQTNLSIVNDSSDFVRFKWSPFENSEEELLINDLLVGTFNNVQDFDSKSKRKLITWMKKFSDQPIPYPTNIQTIDYSPFNIEPIEGRIPPYTTHQFIVHFNPEKATIYEDLFYCDVEGVQKRLNLTIHGEGFGPKIKFSYKCLNMGKIFIGSKHRYELVISNTGLIETMFTVHCKTTTTAIDHHDMVSENVGQFAKYFHLLPDEGLICPGGYQVIQIEFYCNELLGQFNEIFQFAFDDGASNFEEITFSGTVVGPTFHFNVSSVEFGQVSYGFSKEKMITLYNTSFIPMDFILRIANTNNDNDHDDKDVSDQMAMINDQTDNKQNESLNTMSNLNKSFQLTPNCGNLLPMSSINILIQFRPKYLGIKQYKLLVDIVNVSKQAHWLPIYTEAIRPDVIVTPELINLKRCFINYPYTIEMTLINQSIEPASYQFIEQLLSTKQNETKSVTIQSTSNQEGSANDESKLQYWTNNPEGFINGSSSVKIPVTFKAKALGPITSELCFKICGINENPLKIPIKCMGEGPVLHVDQTKLEWGLIPVLQPINKTLRISNESCIDANYTAKMLRNDTVYKVEPCTGCITGYSYVDLNIAANLNDILLFKDQLIIHVENTLQPLKIELNATGQGGTIVTQPSMGSILNLGSQFSVNPMRKQFKVINKGRRSQQIIWSIDGQSPRKSIQTDGQLSNKPESKWSITPHRFDLNPGASTEICLEVQCDSAKTVQEKILCHSIIGRSAKYLIKTIDVSIDFIKPMIELSTSELVYRIEKLSNKSESKWSITPHRFDLNPGASTEICLEVQCDCAKTVQEKILCHSIIGRSAKYLIKTIDVSIDFIKPMIELSTSELVYRIEKGPFDELSTQFNHFTMTNKIDLVLTCLLEVCNPFHLCIDQTYTSKMTFQIKPFESKEITVSFNPKYKDDLFSRRADELLFIKYAEHPQIDAVRLIGEVHFPNVQFSSKLIDFGCILNNTEMTEHLTMKNISPLPVKFRWSLLIGDRPNIIFKRQARLTEHPVIVNDTELEHYDAIDNKNAEQITMLENNLQDTCTNDTDQIEHETQIQTEQQNDSDQNLPVTEINKPTDENISADENPNTNSSSPDNRILRNLIEEDEDIVPLGIEELFDLVPLYGEINPSETISLSCTFYGHSEIEASVLALCEIEGGPEYKIELKGSASEIDFQLDQTDLDVGYIRLDKSMICEFNILNTGKVQFDFTIQLTSKSTQFGQFKIEPFYGQINGNQSQPIRITFLPCRPGYFEQEFTVQIAYFLPKLIKIHGIIDFAHLNLNLPRGGMISSDDVQQSLNNDQLSIIDEETAHFHDPSVFYQLTMSKLLSDLHHEVINLIDLWEKQQTLPIVCLCQTVFSDTSHTLLIESVKNINLDRIFMHDANCPITKAIKQYLTSHYYTGINNFPEKLFQLIPDLNLQLDAERSYICNLLDTIESNELNIRSSINDENNVQCNSDNDCLKMITEIEEQVKPCFVKNLYLPSYLLDFGVVILGTIVKQTITVINTNYEPISFRFDTTSLSKAKQFGFNMNITKIHHLPGSPEYEPLDIEISLDTKQMNQCITNESLIQTELLIKIRFTPIEEKKYETKIQLNIENSSDTMLKIHCQGKGLEPQLTFDRVMLQFTPILPYSINGSEELVTITNPCDYPIEFYSVELDKQAVLEDEILRFIDGYDEYGRLILPPRKPGDGLPSEILSYYEEYANKIVNTKFSDELDETIRQENSDEKNIKELKFIGVSSSSSTTSTTSTTTLTTATSSSSLKELKKSSTSTTNTTTTPTNNTNSTTTTTNELLEPPHKFDKPTTLLSELFLHENLSTDLSNFNQRKPTFDVTPVSLALTRYLGVDSMQDPSKCGKFGIVILVNGALESIRHDTVNNLANQYQAMIFNLNQIIIEALLTSTTEAAYQARQLCLNVGLELIQTKLLEKQHQQQQQQQDHDQLQQQLQMMTDLESKLDSPTELLDNGPKEETIQEGNHSSVTSIDGEQSKLKAGHQERQHKLSINRQGQGPFKIAGQRDLLNITKKLNDMSLISPELNSTLKPRRITYSSMFNNNKNDSIKSFIDKSPLKSLNNEQLYTTILPDEIILQLIQEYLNQLHGCSHHHQYQHRYTTTTTTTHKGIIINGLESEFTKNATSTLELLLKCFKNNYQYFYTLSLKSNYDQYKQCIYEQQLDLNEAQILLNQQYCEKLDNLTDYEYEELVESERHTIDQLQLKIRREKRQIELEQKRIQEEQLREEQEAEAKRLEMER